MKKRSDPHLPRRGIALAAAVATLWVVFRTADLGAARTALLSSGQLVTSLLELQMGQVQEETSCLNGWSDLVVDQSPVLVQGKEAVNNYLQDQAAPASDPVPATDPADQADSSDSADTSAGASSASAPQSGKKEEETEEEPAKAVSLDLSSIKASQLHMDNHTDHLTPSPSKYWKEEPALTLQPAENGPQILIMHTHATESYTMEGDDVYTESDESRTTDENFNMIRVGEEMKAVFEQQGLSVVHDKTTYDYPGYNGSYGRSLAGIQSYLEQYPTIQVVLDVHRDALIASDGTVYSKTTTIDGEDVAQVMLVVGTDDGGLTHPDWRNNFTLALKLQGAMLATDPTLPRNIDLRSQRFNQHLTPGSLLVEVGTSGNTLQEALAGARLFAQAAGQVYAKYVED